MSSVVDRFLKYVSFDTQSDGGSGTVPSTEKQFDLAKYLEQEMKEIGVSNVYMDEHGYVFGEIPANTECDFTLGFVAHVDTVPGVSGADIKPRIIKNYAGGPIQLNEEISIDLTVSPKLETYIGQDLIVTDGTTLLGADDKAGVAEIMSMAERIISDETFRHGKILLAFTPDEEVGGSIECFDLSRFPADFAYTVDGGTVGEIEYENFNAASASVCIKGIEIHPGSAKNIMKNAITIGMEFDRMLPAQQRPEYTEGYEGFFHLTSFEGSVTQTKLDYIIRDHDAELFARKKALVEAAAAYINEKYGAVATVEITDSYKNMREKVLPHMHLVDNAVRAFQECGVTPAVIPIRGGTDGAQLSYKGIPCPNLSTGGENAHSVREYISVQSLEKMVDVLESIVNEYCLF